MTAILDLPEVRERIMRWSVEDYERLAELKLLPKHTELLRGLIVEKASKSLLHNFLTNRITTNLVRQPNSGFDVRSQSPLRLTDSVPIPVVSVVRGRSEDFYDQHPTTAELVVEVAVGSGALERANASLYAEAGVAEYWIALGEAEHVEVYRRPENGIYQEMRVYSREETIPCPIILEGSVSVTDWFARKTRYQPASPNVGDYRIDPEEAETLDDWRIVNEVIFRVADDAPDTSDPEEVRRFFDQVPHVPAAAYAAWCTAGTSGNGGMWMIFEVYCALFIEKAISGYSLFGEEHAANDLRRFCQLFPDGQLPPTPEEAQSALEKLTEAEDFDEETFPSFDFEGGELNEESVSCSKILREHRGEFIREHAST